MHSKEYFLQIAIELSRKGMETGEGGPFGSIVVKNNTIIGKGWNQVLLFNDPTAHAEIVAIRNACKSLKSFDLSGCEIYTSCEPCPMCLGAIYWARPTRVYYANTKEDAASIEFDDSLIYNEINLDHQDKSIPLIKIEMPEAIKVFQDWHQKPDKSRY